MVAEEPCGLPRPAACGYMGMPVLLAAGGAGRGTCCCCCCQGRLPAWLVSGVGWWLRLAPVGGAADASSGLRLLPACPCCCWPAATCDEKLGFSASGGVAMKRSRASGKGPYRMSLSSLRKRCGGSGAGQAIGSWEKLGLLARDRACWYGVMLVMEVA